jgi:hypothetical protein
MSNPNNKVHTSLASYRYSKSRSDGTSAYIFPLGGRLTDESDPQLVSRTHESFCPFPGDRWIGLSEKESREKTRFRILSLILDSIPTRARAQAGTMAISGLTRPSAEKIDLATYITIRL